MLVHRLRRWPNMKPTLAQYIVSAGDYYPENTRHGSNIVSMLDQRLRRWPSIDPPSDSCIVFAGWMSDPSHLQ